MYVCATPPPTNSTLFVRYENSALDFHVEATQQIHRSYPCIDYASGRNPFTRSLFLCFQGLIGWRSHLFNSVTYTAAVSLPSPPPVTRHLCTSYVFRPRDSAAIKITPGVIFRPEAVNTVNSQSTVYSNLYELFRLDETAEPFGAQLHFPIVDATAHTQLIIDNLRCVLHRLRAGQKHPVLNQCLHPRVRGKIPVKYI